MNVIKAVNSLNKYNLYDSAQRECMRRKIVEHPYDMIGHHAVYCLYLRKKQCELQDCLTKLQNVKCSELDNIPDIPKHICNDCFSICTHNTKDYCKSNCKYYAENIAELVDQIKELVEAQKVLKVEAEENYSCR